MHPLFYFIKQLLKLGNDGFSLVLFGTKVSNSKKSIKLFLLLFLLTGCSVKNPTPKENFQNIQSLTQMLLRTSKHIDRNEAEDLAKSSVHYAQKLSKKYKVVSPPLWQNTLVNIGLKKRGLCYEWANDLWVYLKAKEYKSLELHYIGADVGSYFEHNALSVSAKGKSVQESIVLDAWRNSGKLYFIEIDKDEKYVWKKRYD